jgi:hypothetical protein
MKVFISQPMAGKSDQEIIAERERIKALIEQWLLQFPGKYPYDGVIDIIDTFFQGTREKPLVCLARALELLAGADFAVFAPGWENTRGCRIEADCCRAYGIPHFTTKCNGKEMFLCT